MAELLKLQGFPWPALEIKERRNIKERELRQTNSTVAYPTSKK